MDRHYSTRSVFWQLPNALLARYFAESSLSGDLSFPALKATKAEAPVEACLAVWERQRNSMDAEFQGMFKVRCERCVGAMVASVENYPTAV